MVCVQKVKIVTVPLNQWSCEKLRTKQYPQLPLLQKHKSYKKSLVSQKHDYTISNACLEAQSLLFCCCMLCIIIHVITKAGPLRSVYCLLYSSSSKILWKQCSNFKDYRLETVMHSTEIHKCLTDRMVMNWDAPTGHSPCTESNACLKNVLNFKINLQPYPQQVQ